MKVDVDVKEATLKKVEKSEKQQESIMIDTLEKQSPFQIVQNFKTVTGYERRIATDEMQKLYSDKASVQRIVCIITLIGVGQMRGYSHRISICFVPH